MKVNRSNYEIWIIDWLDGNLSEPQSAELLTFLGENPDLKEEMEALTRFRLEKPLKKFSKTDSLKKTAADLTDTQFEYLCIAHTENDLSAEQEKELDEIIRQSQERKMILEAFQKTVLTPPDYRFGKKSLLKKEPPGEKIFRLSVRILSAAASIALLISLYLLVKDRLPENTIASGEPLLDSLSVVISNPIRIEKQLIASTSNSAPSARINKTFASSEEIIANVIQPDDSMNNQRLVENLHIAPEILLATFTIEHPAEINNLIAYNPEIITPAVDIERSSVGKFLSRTYRNLILNEEAATDLPIKGYEIAEGGINGLNKLFGWEMALQKTNDENGDLQSLYFSSKMLKFNAPVKKSETTP
jgi:hypothetical protein